MKDILDQAFSPSLVENETYAHWENQGYFKPGKEGDAYCIMLPPPNVTGSLHMGHGFQHTLMDILTRYHRMKGDSTLWQPGTDHAGISTQMVVERQLLKDNISRHTLGREKFVEKIWEWKKFSGNRITEQMRHMGSSPDWSREKFTLDEDLSQAVREVFIRLYEEKSIYRGLKLVNWDPKLLTAISDLEVISEEEDTNLWHIRYPIENSTEYLVVATTRPETLLGDTAVVIHPEDTRYNHLLGQFIQLPLTDRRIPIIADEMVDKEFATGCVKVTPAHDFNDYEVGLRHNLPMINIFTPTAHLNENVPLPYQGLERFEARALVLKHLEDNHLLEKIEPYKTKIPRGDRSGVVVEPYLTQQWFLKMEEFAKPAMEVVRNGQVRFIPNNWETTYFQWMENIHDWCISRQLWWGHRIPAWYDEAGNIYVGHSEETIRKKHKLSQDITLTQDTDVLDTWFSSALWPFSTLGWPHNTEELKRYYPTQVLVTGFDIIFFWVARMIMMGLKFMGDVPFKEVYITGLIRDGEGQKMSKTKGNVIDPIDLIEGISLEKLLEKRTSGLMQPQMAKDIEKNTRKQFPEGIAAYGTDAVRFTFCALASTTRNIRFDIQRLAGYRNFCNKLWNASRYVVMNTQGISLSKTPRKLNLADKWILSRLNKTIAEVYEHMKDYRFDLLAQKLYEFTWNEFCDWYLELSKPVLTGGADILTQDGTRHTLLFTLDAILRMLHPIMPFITESLWQHIKSHTAPGVESIMISRYPTTNPQQIDEIAEEETQWLQNVITAIRNIRAEMNIAPSKPLPVIFYGGEEGDHCKLIPNKEFLCTLAKLEKITWSNPGEKLPPSASALVGTLQLHIPLEGLIDKKAENERLSRELVKLKKDLERCEAKLKNPSFVDKAPAEVVLQEKERVDELSRHVKQTQEQLKKLAALR